MKEDEGGEGWREGKGRKGGLGRRRDEGRKVGEEGSRGRKEIVDVTTDGGGRKKQNKEKGNEDGEKRDGKGGE